jgi:predicted aconitase with swiveling domain
MLRSFSGGSASLAYSKTEKRVAGKQQYMGNGDVRVKHREYLFTVPGSVAFAVTSYSLNPGLAQTFPWLSGIASRYESYLEEGFKICFDTMKSASTNGRIMLAVDFDASDAAPVSVQEMMNNEGAVDAAVWREKLEYVAPVHDLRKFGIERYLRSGTAPSGSDIKTFDVGNILIATEGCADTTSIGHVYLEYTTLLRTPQFSTASSALAGSAKITSGGTSSKTALFGTVPVVTGGLPLTALNNTITWGSVGQFMVVVQIQGTGITGTAATITGTATQTTGSNLSGAVLFNATSGTSTVGSMVLYFTVTALGQTTILDFSAGSTTITSAIANIGPFAATLATT